jgi:hypothetical protein
MSGGGNPNHDSRGRFSSGSSATGDHQASATPERTPRLPVKAHAGVPSVGTGFAVRVKPKGPRLDTPPARDPQQTTTGLRRAARERAELNRRVDRGHYPDFAAELKDQFRRKARA